MSAIACLDDLDCILRHDLMAFTERSFLELHPEANFSMAPHLEVMAGTLSVSLQGTGSKRLIINLPPRSLMSVTVSVSAVAWLLGKDPTQQIICASYGQDPS